MSVLINIFSVFIFIAQNSVASNLCDGKICIQKCCPEGEYFLSKGTCKSLPEKRVFQNVAVFDKNLKKVGRFDDFFAIKSGSGAFVNEEFRKHSYGYWIMYKNYYLIEDGQMILERSRTGELLDFLPENYCFDHRINVTLSIVSEDPVVIFENKSKVVQGNHITLKWGFLISSVFLFLVLVVYGLLPELRNLGGLILMAYVASLMLGFIFLFCIQISASGFDTAICLTITSLTYFFLLASFCWLNVMSFDIWWTFRGYAKARPINRRGETVKFVTYCAYAFGVPLGLTIAVVTLNEVNHLHRLKGIVPDIPGKGCFIEGWAKYAYLYTPMLILIIMNWLFFVLTAFNIWRLSRGSDVLRNADSGAAGSSSAHKNSKQRLIVYLKLSVLMGLSWILEVVSTTSPNFAGWYITDCYNVLVGVMIFIIFVCKKKVLNKLKKRYMSFKSTHKFSFQYKSRSRSTQDESHTQSIPLQLSPDENIALPKYSAKDY